MKSLIVKLLGPLVLVCGLLCFTSCEKEAENSFVFSAEGGPYEFNTEVDGSSLKIYSGDVSSRDAKLYNNSQWVAELDWIIVFYIPAEQHIHVGVHENTTGKKRTARVTAVRNGKQVVLCEFKQNR